MPENDKRWEGIDFALFEENRRKFPPEELAKYAGKYIAWNADGTRILASGDDYEEVDKKLEAQGIPFSHVMHSYVDLSDMAYF